MKIRRGILLVSWLLSLICISFYGGTVSYGFFFGVTLIPVISLIYLVFVYFRFKIFQELGTRNVVCGEPVSYYFVLQNDDWFAFSGVSVRMFSDFSYVEEMPDELEYELLPGESFRYETRLVCKYRGEYEVGVREIVVSDFFGLFRLRYKITGTLKALVVPKLVKVNELKSISDVSALLQREALRMETELDALTRDYATGDSLKQIHWKAAAREQKLKVRNRIGEEKQGVSIVFDTNRCHKDNRVYLPVENKILELTIALGFFLAEKNISSRVYYRQRQLCNVLLEGIRSFDSFYQKMAGTIFSEEENTTDMISRIMEKGRLTDSLVVFFILHEINDEILLRTQPLLERGIITVFYVVTDASIESYCRQSNLNRRVIAVSPEGRTEEVL